MELYSQNLEIRCIRTICNTEMLMEEREMLVGRLDKSFFHFPPTRGAYRRITSVAATRSVIIDYEDLVEDPTLEEDFRDILRDVDVRPCKGQKAIGTMLTQLGDYRRARYVYSMCKDAINSLKEDKVDTESLLTHIGEEVAKARNNLSEEQKVYTLGYKSNSKRLIKDTLYRDRPPRVKTGFKDFDNENGGFPVHGVVILAGTTSGGKSVMALNILKYTHETQFNDVCRVSFEMDEYQETERFMSLLTGIPYYKFSQNKLDQSEKRKVESSMSKFNTRSKRNKSKFSIICPSRSLTIDETLMMIKPFGYDVVAIDYVTLLEGVDEDNQARALSSIVRKCKLFSKETQTLIILLAQLDSDTDKVRYSRAMQEHADVLWTWNYSKPEQRELKLLPIKAVKVRDGKVMNFELKDEFETMKLENLDADSYGSSNGVGGLTDEDSSEDDSDQSTDYGDTGIT